MISGLFEEIPRIDERGARRCGDLVILWRILVPIATPASERSSPFIFCWNDFLFALILTTQKALTFLPLLTRYVLPQGPQYGQIFAGATIFLIPPMIALLVIRGRLSEAFSLGGIH